jgi:peptidoglycan/LPS O-acetylase OafA/YrhL
MILVDEHTYRKEGRKEGRIFVLDFLRFFAIFLVTGFHVSRFFGFDSLNSVGIIFKNSFITGGWLGVCLFFFLSGYCLCINYNSQIKYFDFLKKEINKNFTNILYCNDFWVYFDKNGSLSKAY